MIIFMGVAGSGKSKQGKLLADKAGLPWLSTGEFLRMLVSGERRKAMVAGELLDDQEIISLVQKIFNIIDTKHEFILDGFPRTVRQADWLLHQHEHGQISISGVVHLIASEEVVKNRLIARGRQDDSETAIKQRFKEYKEAVLPILDKLQEAGIKVHTINGEQSVEAVSREISQALKLA